MFRKIVSHLSFSPALVGQLGFYAKRLRKEETTRRLGLVFVALALVVQSLVVFQPPESANAASANDLVPGGLGLGANRSLDKFLAPYDSNTRNLQDISRSLGLTRAEIASAQYGSFITGTVKRSFGFTPKYSPAQGEVPVGVYNTDGNKIFDIYSRPLSLANGPNARIYGWTGYSAKAGWFAIMQACGNIVLEVIPSPPPPPTPPTPPPPPPPTPGPGPAIIELSKTVTNISQGNIDAQTVAAKESDKISFTLTIRNGGGTAEKVIFQDYLEDTLEYSRLIDKGGGIFDDDKQILSWPEVEVGPGETQTRTFAVQMLATIPTTPRGSSEPASYDCLMVNAFGMMDVTVPVVCAPPKVIEQVVTQLPKTGPTENMIFAGVVLAVVTFFFFRSKQLSKEVRLIRRDLNAGTI